MPRKPIPSPPRVLPFVPPKRSVPTPPETLPSHLKEAAGDDEARRRHQKFLELSDEAQRAIDALVEHLREMHVPKERPNMPNAFRSVRKWRATDKHNVRRAPARTLKPPNWVWSASRGQSVSSVLHSFESSNADGKAERGIRAWLTNSGEPQSTISI